MMIPQTGANICRRHLFHDQNSSQTQGCTDDQRKRVKPIKRYSALKEVRCLFGSRVGFPAALTFHLSLFPSPLPFQPNPSRTRGQFILAIHSFESPVVHSLLPAFDFPSTHSTPTSLTHVAFFLHNLIVGPHPIHPLSWRSDNKKINPRALGTVIDTHDLLAHSFIVWRGE